MKEKAKIAITGKKGEYNESVSEYLKKNGYAVTLASKDAQKVIETAKSVDVLVMDTFLNGLDALGVLKELSTMERKPVIIVMSAVDNESFEDELMKNGADYYILKPFKEEMLEERIKQLLKWKNKENSKSVKVINSEIEKQKIISEVMRQIGVPAHIKGYQYLRQSIMLCMEEPEYMQAVTKELYPQVAKENSTTPSRVERAIRHAIEVAWDRGDVDVLNSYFGYTIENTRGKPTNSEFIAMISDKLRLDMKVG